MTEHTKIFDGSELTREARERWPILAEKFDALRRTEQVLELADAGDFAPGDIVEWERSSGGKHEGQHGYGQVVEVGHELAVVTVALLRETERGLVLDGNRTHKSVSMTLVRKSSKKLAGEPTGSPTGFQSGPRSPIPNTADTSETADLAVGSNSFKEGDLVEVDESNGETRPGLIRSLARQGDYAVVEILKPNPQGKLDVADDPELITVPISQLRRSDVAGQKPRKREANLSEDSGVSSIEDLSEAGEELNVGGVPFITAEDPEGEHREQWHRSTTGRLSDEDHFVASGENDEAILDWFLRKVGRRR